MTPDTATEAPHEALRPDPWLGDVLGKPAYRLDPDADPREPDAVLARAGRDGPTFVDAKVSTRDVDLVARLTAAGFRVVDVNVTLERDPDPRFDPGGPGDAVEVREAEPSDRAAIVDVAGATFELTRFHLDPHIPDKAADQVKRAWVDNYFAGGRGERLLVGVADGAPAGFLCDLAADGDAGGRLRVIDLIGVGPDHQARGVGTALVARFVRDAAETCDRLRVGTQAANTGSIRFYERLGFETVETRYVLHANVGTDREDEGADAGAPRGTSP